MKIELSRRRMSFGVCLGFVIVLLLLTSEDEGPCGSVISQGLYFLERESRERKLCVADVKIELDLIDFLLFFQLSLSSSSSRFVVNVTLAHTLSSENKSNLILLSGLSVFCSCIMPYHHHPSCITIHYVCPFDVHDIIKSKNNSA